MIFSVIVSVYHNRLYCFVNIRFCFQAEDGIRDLVRSRGLGDVYKRQASMSPVGTNSGPKPATLRLKSMNPSAIGTPAPWACLLYTSDAADERSSVDLGGRRIIKKKKKIY